VNFFSGIGGTRTPHTEVANTYQFNRSSLCLSKGLSEVGYIVRETVAIEYGWAKSDLESCGPLRG